jgi:histidinol dehydrogenase
VLIVRSLKEAVEVANSIAPEHLEVMTRRPRKLLPLIKNAGAVFLGQWSPEPLGDYAAGPNHTLPTGGTARWASPLGVYDFVKRSSLLEFTKKGFLSLAGPVEKIAEVEGLDAHAASVRIRRSQGK